MAGLDRLAVEKVDLDQLLTGGNSRYDFLCFTVDYRAAIWIGILAIQC